MWKASRPAHRDHHWDDQYHVLLMDDVQYTQWFRMEGDFTPGMRRIFERIGLAGERWSACWPCRRT